MDYKSLSSYKLLLALGCTDTTGPQMLKKGIVKFTIPGDRYFEAVYHFDPAYKLGDSKIVAKAVRRAGASATDFFIKKPGPNDYDLAFKAFILNMLGIRNIKKLDMNKFPEIVESNRKVIFDKIFNQS